MIKLNLKSILFSGLSTLLLITSCKKEESKPIKLVQIEIKSEPFKTSYFLGESLNLEGLIISVTLENGTVEDWTLNDFNKKDIQVEPGNGEVLKQVPIEIEISHSLSEFSRKIVLDCETVADADNYTYPIVKAGEQYWMGQNLKTTKYNNGDEIGTTDPVYFDVTGEVEPKYQWPCEGDETNVDVYGRFYTWYVVEDERNICPVGWHVPNDNEWNSLMDYLGGGEIAGGKLKCELTEYWVTDNIGATNEIGFNAIPAGGRGAGEFPWGPFGGFGSSANWWSATEYSPEEGVMWFLGASDTNLGYLEYGKKFWANSIRCIKD